MLTPEPISIGLDPTSIAFDEPIKAITGGASVNIDVSTQVNLDGTTNIFEEIKRKFPQGCLKAVLTSVDGEAVELEESSGRLSANQAFVNLRSKEGVPTGILFTSMELTSCREIIHSKVTWYNYSN